MNSCCDDATKSPMTHCTLIVPVAGVSLSGLMLMMAAMREEGEEEAGANIHCCSCCCCVHGRRVSCCWLTLPLMQGTTTASE
jgi:hypothetical protein